jgi:hypothetical protein
VDYRGGELLRIFHRIRHYGFFASPGRAGAILRLRDLIAACDGTAQPSRDVGAGDKATDPEPPTTRTSYNPGLVQGLSLLRRKGSAGSWGRAS